jgi:hypothetical protein
VEHESCLYKRTRVCTTGHPSVSSQFSQTLLPCCGATRIIERQGCTYMLLVVFVLINFTVINRSVRRQNLEFDGSYRPQQNFISGHFKYITTGIVQKYPGRNVSNSRTKYRIRGDRSLHKLSIYKLSKRLLKRLI